MCSIIAIVSAGAAAGAVRGRSALDLFLRVLAGRASHPDSIPVMDDALHAELVKLHELQRRAWIARMRQVVDHAPDVVRSALRVAPGARATPEVAVLSLTTAAGRTLRLPADRDVVLAQAQPDDVTAGQIAQRLVGASARSDFAFDPGRPQMTAITANRTPAGGAARSGPDRTLRGQLTAQTVAVVSCAMRAALIGAGLNEISVSGGRIGEPLTVTADRDERQTVEQLTAFIVDRHLQLTLPAAATVTVTAAGVTVTEPGA